MLQCRVALSDVAVIDEATGPVGQTRQLGTAPQTATTWLWEQSRVPAGSTAILSSTSIRNPVFTPDVEGIYVFRLTAGGGPVPSITTVTLSAWLPPAAAVDGVVGMCTGGTATIQATLSGSSPWNVTWSDAVMQSGIESSPVSRVVGPGATTTYSVTAVSNPYSSGASTGTVTVVVNERPAPPAIAAPASLWPEQPFSASDVPGRRRHVQGDQSLDGPGPFHPRRQRLLPMMSPEARQVPDAGRRSRNGWIQHD